MKILLIVPDGVAVRNYLYSNFITALNNKGAEVTVYHQISEGAINEVKTAQKNIKSFHLIPRFIEKPKARLLRESLAYARLLRNKKQLKNNSILSFWNKNHKGIKQKILYRLAELLGYMFSKSYSVIRKMDASYEKAISNSDVIKSIEKDFNHFKPDLVLNLHQRSPVSAPIINVAKAQRIKTATVIFSWDNVPKARLISRYDTYLVWSNLMKNELDILYPEIKSKQIKVVGTPQFEFYFNDKFHQSKSTFFYEYGLNENKKTVCFSSNDASSPYEANYFEDICNAISEINEIDRPQVLFRRCPVDKSDRFDPIIEKYKSFVITIDPDWRLDNSSDTSFKSIYPAYNDFWLLVNTVKHSDVVINLGSTMAHDFAVLNKPCLYLNYDPVSNSKFLVKTAYEFQHFRSMNNLDAVGWINSKEQIKEQLLEAIETPNTMGKDRKKWMEKIVLHPLEENSKKIAEAII